MSHDRTRNHAAECDAQACPDWERDLETAEIIAEARALRADAAALRDQLDALHPCEGNLARHASLLERAELAEERYDALASRAAAARAPGWEALT